jgi:hypothetical protein
VNRSNSYNALAGPHPIFEDFKDYLDRGFREPWETLSLFYNWSHPFEGVGILRIVKPPANKVAGKFARSQDIRRVFAKTDFLRLANVLSSLYPINSEEKRLLDAMLLAMPR